MTVGTAIVSIGGYQGEVWELGIKRYPNLVYVGDIPDPSADMDLLPRNLVEPIGLLGSSEILPDERVNLWIAEDLVILPRDGRIQFNYERWYQEGSFLDRLRELLDCIARLYHLPVTIHRIFQETVQKGSISVRGRGLNIGPILSAYWYGTGPAHQPAEARFEDDRNIKRMRKPVVLFEAAATAKNVFAGLMANLRVVLYDQGLEVEVRCLRDPKAVLEDDAPVMLIEQTRDRIKAGLIEQVTAELRKLGFVIGSGEPTSWRPTVIKAVPRGSYDDLVRYFIKALGRAEIELPKPVIEDRRRVRHERSY